MDAQTVESELFKPSPSGRYLLSSFGLPSIARERELSDSARWLGLGAVLRAAAALRAVDESDSQTASESERWLKLLKWCSEGLRSETERLELEALITALERLSAQADAEGANQPLDALWTKMSEAMAGEAPKPKGSTLRGRRWGSLRGKLAALIAELVESAAKTNMLPRDPRKRRMFTWDHFEPLDTALKATQGSSLVAVAARPGCELTEFAISFASDAYDEGRYERVFFLRADDRLRLERDFLQMARILAPDERGGQGALRRAAFEVLERTDRWLIIIHAIADPAILFGFLPWHRVGGHIICNHILDERLGPGEWTELEQRDEDRWDEYLHGQGPDRDGPPPWRSYADLTGYVKADPARWRDYFDLECKPNLVPSMGESDVARFLGATLPDDPSLEEPLRAMAKLVMASPQATRVAQCWLEQTALPQDQAKTDLVRHARLQLERWCDLAKDVPIDLAPEVAVAQRAVMIVLEELNHRCHADGWWRAVEGELQDREQAAFDLLVCLEVYANWIFPAAVLDDEKWQRDDDSKLRPLLEDQRIVLLENWGLAGRATNPGHDYFELGYTIVHDAILRSKVYGDADLAKSSRTMLRLMRELTPERHRDWNFDLLPHAIEVAHNEVPSRTESKWGPRPLVAVELVARAALCHLAVGRERTGTSLMNRALEILRCLGDRQPSPLIPNEEEWYDAYEPAAGTEGLESRKAGDELESPLVRMHRLVNALRGAGFPEQAGDIYDAVRALVDKARVGGGDGELRSAQVARLDFEGAVALRDRGSVAEAKDTLSRAIDGWEEHATEGGNDPEVQVLRERWIAICENVGAGLLLDCGRLDDARELAQRVLETRESLRDRFDAVPGRKGKALAELARTRFLLGRIAYREGELGNAYGEFEQSAKAWDEAAKCEKEQGTEEFLRPMYQLEARSCRALLAALVGNRGFIDTVDGRALTAESAALHAWRKSEQITPVAHWRAAFVRANYGEVLRLSGKPFEAADEYTAALATWDRTLEPGHPRLRHWRRRAAEVLLDAGRLEDAYKALLDLLESEDKIPFKDVTGSAAVLQSARVWATLGHLLVDGSLTSRPLRAETEAARRIQRDECGFVLDVLKHALFLYETAAADGAAPGRALCLMNLGEMHIRLCDYAEAVAPLERAVEFAKTQLARPRDASQLETVPDILMEPIARYARAYALAYIENGRGSVDELHRIAEALPSMTSDQPVTPRARLELALAGPAVELALHKPRLDLPDGFYDRARRSMIPDQTDDASKNARAAATNGARAAESNRAKAALAPLLKRMSQEQHRNNRHQAVARAYAELGDLAYRVGNAHQRARNDREFARYQPLWSLPDRRRIERLLIESHSRAEASMAGDARMNAALEAGALVSSL